MPNIITAAPTITARQFEYGNFDPFATTTSITPGVLPTKIPVIIDNTQLPPIAMLAVRLYAFGGLAFMCGVFLSGIIYWIWVVAVKGEFADSPPYLDLHPERMREKEKARIERLRIQKEKRDAKRREREAVRWSEFPTFFEKKKKRPSKTTTANVSAARTPTKSALRTSSSSSTRTRHRNKNNSNKAGPSRSGKKQVSWAQSTSTIDKDGNQATKPLKDKPDFPSLPRTPIREVPPARRKHPRVSTSIERRSARGPELMGTMDPEAVSNWSRPPG